MHAPRNATTLSPNPNLPLHSLKIDTSIDVVSTFCPQTEEDCEHRKIK
jgi:hypothetical protein